MNRLGDERACFEIDLPKLDGGYGDLLDDIESVLKQHGVAMKRRMAISNIVIEYLENSRIHSKGPADIGTLFVREEENVVVVGVDGEGCDADVSHMEQVIDRYHGRTQDELRSELRALPFGEKQWNTPGSSIGLLTVATLATEPITFNGHRVRDGRSRYKIEARVATKV